MVHSKDLKSYVQDKVLLLVFACLFVSFPAQAVEKNSAFSLPSDFARIEKIQAGTNGKTIVLIQEAHVDYGAQKAIAEILKSLIEKDSLRLVLVEGGWDDMSLTDLRTYGSESGRLEVADRYLKDGKISGEEYLDVISDFEFKIWGIENPKFYEENMQAFLKIQPEQTQFLPKISEFETFLGQFGEKLFPPAIHELHQRKTLFEAGKINLFDYLLALKKLAGDGQALDAFPTVKKLVRLLTGESDDGAYVDSAKAEQEKQALIRALSQKLTKPELATIELLRNRKSVQEELEFLKSLLDFYQKYQPKLKSVSVAGLQHYVRALENVNNLAPDALFSEIGKFEAEITNQAHLSPDQKKLNDIFRCFQILKKLFELRLDSEGFEELEKNPSAFDLNDWAAFLQGQAARFSVQPAAPFDLNEAQKWISEAKRFYISARKREGALIENTVKKIEAEKSSKTALIVGGFHSKKLAKALNKRGYSVVVVAPRFTPADPKSHDQHYFEILKYKWDSRSNVSLSPSQKLS